MIELEQAERIIDAILARSRGLNCRPISVVVVEPGGPITAFKKGSLPGWAGGRPAKVTWVCQLVDDGRSVARAASRACGSARTRRSSSRKASRRRASSG